MLVLVQASTTLCSMFDKVAAEYYRSNLYEMLNHIDAQCIVPHAFKLLWCVVQ